MANISFIDVEVDASKVISDTEDELVVPVVLTREGVVPYPHGKAYRPADELLKGAHTFEYLRITESKHPQARNPSGTALDQLITDPGQDVGHIQNVQFIADSVDAKGRKSAKLIGEGHIYKKNLYRGLPVNAASPTFLKGVAAGSIKQVSIGIIRDEEITPGEWQGEKYDFVHRNIVGNHLAVGVPNARTKPPYIGVGVDSKGSNVDEMSVQDIEAKITELQTESTDLQKDLDAIYQDENKQLNDIEKKIQEQFGKERESIRKATSEKTRDLYQRMDNLRYEISAFHEAKVAKEVSGQTSSDAVAPALDVWEVTDDYIRSGHGSAENAEKCRTTDFDGKLPDGIKAIYCKKKDSDEWYIQSYLFPKDKFTLAEAKAWFKSQTSTDAESPPSKSTAELVQKVKKYVR